MNVKADNQLDLPDAAKALAPRKSMDEIAAMLAENTLKMRGEDKTAPNEVIEDDPDAEDEIDDGDVDSSDDSDVSDDADALDTELEDDDSDGDADDADEESAEDDAEDEEDDEEGDSFIIDDDDLLEIDEDTTVSIADLKKVYQADKTVAAAVAVQEEATSEALHMRARAQDDSMKAQGAINAMMKHLVDVVNVPLITAPNEALKTSDPDQYIRHLDAYNQDQARITAAQGDLSGALEAFNKQADEVKQARKKEEMQVLLTKLPALQNEATRPKASQDILDAAAYYGFAPEEVNDAIDHRIYRMAYDAQQYRNLMKASGKKEVKLVEDKAKKKVSQTRTLRSKGTSAKSRVSSQAKQVKRLKTAAKSTGKAKDVAAFLAAKRS